MRDGRKKRGFTLLELMVVVAVIAILALVALPSYLDRIVREQIRDALPLADILKPPVAAAWRNGTPLPADNAAAGLPAADRIVSDLVQSVALENGAIHLTFGNRAHKSLQGKVLTMRPAGVEDARVVPVTWLCGHASAPDKMAAQGQDRTTVAAAMLPLRCR